MGRACISSFNPPPTASYDQMPQSAIDAIDQLPSSYSLENKQLIKHQLVQLGLAKTGEDGQLHPTKSTASLIADKGLGTICSISGTTVETAVWFMKDDPQMYDALLRLASAPQSDVQAAIQSLNKTDFPKIFASITGFMQAGQFHSAAEVLGGMYMSAVAIHNDQSNNEKVSTDVASLLKGYGNLLDALKSNPDLFVNKETAQAA